MKAFRDSIRDCQLISALILSELEQNHKTYGFLMVSGVIEVG